MLDGYEAARKANGPRDSRHRVEHVEVIHPADIPRFKQLGAIASMQPPHPPGSMGLPLEPTVSMIGRDRWPYSYAWRTLKDAGAHIPFASDWPVSPIDPLEGIEAAVTRKKWQDSDPDQSFTLMEAIAAYTVEGFRNNGSVLVTSGTLNIADVFFNIPSPNTLAVLDRLDITIVPNTTTSFNIDNIVLNHVVPEPVTFGLLAVCSLVFLATRRSR